MLDLLIVLSSVQEELSIYFWRDSKAGQSVSFLRILRLLRLAKLLRVVRLMRAFKELRLIMHSIMGSFRAIFWALLFIAGITPVFHRFPTFELFDFFAFLKYRHVYMCIYMYIYKQRFVHFKFRYINVYIYIYIYIKVHIYHTPQTELALWGSGVFIGW